MHHNNNKYINNNYILLLTKIFQYVCITVHVLKVPFLKFGLKSFVPRKKLPSTFRTPWPLGLIIE